MVTEPIGSRVVVDGELCSAFLFQTKAQADAFVWSLMESPDNVAAGVAQLESGTWRVVVGRHFDA